MEKMWFTSFEDMKGFFNDDCKKMQHDFLLHISQNDAEGKGIGNI